MLDYKHLSTLAFSVVGLAQGMYIFLKNRKDKRLAGEKESQEKLNAERRESAEKRLHYVEVELADHIKEDREMHERLQKAETKIDNQQQQINDANARHGDLVKKLDDIQKSMLTKDDFKLLVDVIRNA